MTSLLLVEPSQTPESASGFQHKASEPILLSSRWQSVRDWWLQLSTILALPRGWKRRLQSVGDVAPIKAG